MHKSCMKQLGFIMYSYALWIKFIESKVNMCTIIFCSCSSMLASRLCISDAQLLLERCVFQVVVEYSICVKGMKLLHVVSR